MIQAGSFVTLTTMPPGVDTLPEETFRVFRFCLGRTYRVEEIDRWGMAVLDVSADIDHRFGGFMNDIHVEPEHLLEISPQMMTADDLSAATWRKIGGLLPPP